MTKNPRLIEMSGRVFGLWTVTKKAGNSPGGGALWNCVCACGTEKVVIGGDLRSGKSQSCGCVGSRATIKDRLTTHGMTGTRLHICWKNMHSRCRDNEREHYGGKGIKVCGEWSSFEVFQQWAESSGYSENLTIERLDNSKGYSPENCIWADKKAQARNRTIVKLAPSGKSWAQVAEESGVPVGVMHNRVLAGDWPIEIAATWPVGKRRAEFKRDEQGRMIATTDKIWRR